jgi:cell division transport system permease protein
MQAFFQASYFKRAIQDIRHNRFLNVVTIIIIALATLIFSAFSLFWINTGELMNSWERGLRIMAYLKADLPPEQQSALSRQVGAMTGVASVEFISKQEALERFSNQMAGHAGILAGFAANPLPDALEIRLDPTARGSRKIGALAARIAALSPVEEVEYGRQWLRRFSNILNLFKLSGYLLGTLFLTAAIFIVANTSRLVVYSRREEVEIMRLVGATDAFIKTPFYIEGLIQGAVGGIAGLLILFGLYLGLSVQGGGGFLPGWLNIRFLPTLHIMGIVLTSIAVGWLGCYLSLKQFLK